MIAAFIMAFLKAGYGGLFLTAKRDDAETYERYVRAAGRLPDLRRFGPKEKYRFNPFDAALRSTDAGAGFVEHIVEMLSACMEVAERNGGKGSDLEEGGYFRRAVKALIRAAIEILVLAKGRFTIEELYRIVISAPNSPDERESPAWRGASFCWECIREADANAPPHKRGDFILSADHLFLEWSQLSSRTRSVVLSSFTSMIDPLNRSVCRELIGTTTNLTPEEAYLDGALILLDLPVKLFDETGLFLQVVVSSPSSR
jgi:hypothetical protein